uniref:Uncharacterized protein n=1 Tax=Tetraselmis sp. GSL018 TaxID=582737 RepID=A0A061RAN3_9CHLO
MPITPQNRSLLDILSLSTSIRPLIPDLEVAVSASLYYSTTHIACKRKYISRE